MADGDGWRVVKSGIKHLAICPPIMPATLPLRPAVLLLTALPNAACTLADAIHAAGGRAVVVGGVVRDYLLGLPPKDIDIEAYGLTAETLATALGQVANVHAVGKSFGVLKARIGATEIDVSLPRRERKIGQGHRGFAMDYDAQMPFAEAASRRDFTINAMGVDLSNGELLDPWGGVADLQAKIIRHVSDAFAEDPLRVLRACQFAARLGFTIAPPTLEKCRSLQAELPTLSSERVWEECKKLLLKAPRPAVGVQALAATGALVLLPELADLRTADVGAWQHSHRALDACADICTDACLAEDAALPLLLAALCLGLETAAAQSLLQRLGCPPTLAERSLTLLREQAEPQRLWAHDRTQPVSDGLIRRLALRVPIVHLCRLAQADFQAVANGTSRPCPWVDWLLQRAAGLSVLDKAPQPILQGRDLQAFGVAPGPSMGRVLKAAFDAQLDGAFTDRDGALHWARVTLAVDA